MAKHLIRLTESDLHNIVKESVNKIITEWFDDNGDWNRDFGDDGYYGEEYEEKPKSRGRKY